MMRPASEADREAIADMLGRAFADDPAFSYIFPDPQDRARRLPRLFRLLFDEDGAAGIRITSDGYEAATLWRAPGRATTGILAMARHLFPLLHALGPATSRALRVSSAIEAHFPDHPFWYLHIAGCDPAAQGRGLGGKAIRAGLACGPPDVPTYLETATEGNLSLYRHFGFEVIADWRVGNGGPRFWSMLRAPQEPAGD